MIKPLRVGIIGAGFMGKAHALAWRNVQAVMANASSNVSSVVLELLCDKPIEFATEQGHRLGFARTTDDWRVVVNDADIDVVSITTPNKMHKAMALAAMGAGKHVWCEKPMALTLEDAKAMAKAARSSGVMTKVGYNYIHNPAFIHAKKLLADGSIGRIVHFRGWADEDYMADENLPWTWRTRIEEAGLGALGDLACHLIAMASGLCGPIVSLVADMQTVYKTRPLSDGSGVETVENEDISSALLRFANGFHGSISTSRCAWGRKNKLAFEVHGSKGMICFDQERLNEIQLFTSSDGASAQGFKTILTGVAHPPYVHFVPASGHQLGFNDLKIIECSELLQAIASGEPAYPDFNDALTFEQLIHAMANSAKTGRWVKLEGS